MSDTSYHFSSEQLIRSCPLPKTMFSHKSETSLTIKASKIEPLSLFLKRHKKHLSYSTMEQLIEMIGRQLHHLETENKGIASFNLDDITVFHANADADTGIGNMYFAITNEDKIYDIEDDNQLTITVPYQKEYTSNAKNIAFHSPEFKEFIHKKTIPYNIHFKAGYYSFGLLCLHCYISRTFTSNTSSKENGKEKETHDDDFEKILSPIINTKIYWFLKKVLHEDPSERRYICV
jgi:hypothetical protein